MILKKMIRAICWIIECCGALVAAAGLVLLYVSWLAYLKAGAWPANDVQVLWDNLQSQWPNVDWSTVQKTMNSIPAAVLKLPLWIVFLVVGGSTYLLGVIGADGLDESMSINKKAR